MRHKWKKTESQFIINKNDRIDYTIRKCYICVKCGLKKGNAYPSGSRIQWYDLVYFNGNEILSRSILPFKCIGKQDSIFLTEEDFKL